MMDKISLSVVTAVFGLAVGGLIGLLYNRRNVLYIGGSSRSTSSKAATFKDLYDDNAAAAEVGDCYV